MTNSTEPAAHDADVRIHVSTHPDMETTARLHNEGFDEAMAQHLADDPGAADEWLEGVKAEAKVEAFEEAAADAMTNHPAWNGANEAVRNRMLFFAETYRTTPSKGKK